jgi:hypothetical protein
MRGAVIGGVVVALTLAANLVQAAGNDETSVLQVQLSPLPSQPLPIDPAQPAPRLPPPGQRPWALALRVPQVPCVDYAMRIVPANPGIDPKFILPAPETPGVHHTMRKVTPPPRCTPAPPVVTPAVPRIR